MTWHVIDKGIGVFEGDCLDGLMSLPDNSIDSIVTDPPYGLGFMGKDWDHGVPGKHFWQEMLRVLKPGGYLLAFAGTRTQHRMATNIEDAGFEIRDMIAWVYGSGFPKSRNFDGEWQGWGTALKPALEPVTVARKPLAEKTVATNVLQYNTGALNIDRCRIQTNDKLGGGNNNSGVDRTGKHQGWKRPWMQDSEAVAAAAERSRASTERSETLGRWPANLIHDGSDEVLASFPEAKGQQGAISGKEPSSKTTNAFGEFNERIPSEPRGDKGSAARFFYCAKASKKDREDGNNHPTVKPTDLMAYLCRLVTPPGGVVLDPFAGSGSTGKAAIREGFKFFGMERDTEYLKIALQRIKNEIENNK